MTTSPTLPAAAHRRAAWLVCLSAFLWSIAGVFTRHLSSAEGVEVNFWRSLFCLFGVVAVLIWRERGNPLHAVRAMGLPGLMSGVLWGVQFTFFMLALTRTSTANTLLVCSLVPLVAALLGRVVLGEPIRASTWAAIAAALAGIWWMLRDGVSAAGATGMLIALAVPLASASNYVALKKLHTSVDLTPAVAVGALLSCLGTLPLAWPLGASQGDVAILAMLGLVQLAAPCLIVVRAATRLAPHEVGLLGLLEVVLGPLWAWLGAGEAIERATIEGGLIVLAALAANELLGRRTLAGANHR